MISSSISVSAMGEVMLLLSTILLFPVINVGGTCTLGETDPDETLPCPYPGLYIDMNQPASCDGQITAWNLCYYSPSPIHYGSTLPLELQVWRFDDALTEAVKVVGYEASISIPRVPLRFQCIDIVLDQREYMNISAGDLLGVWMYPNQFLPIVKHTLDFRNLLFAPPSTFNGAVPSVVRIPTLPFEVIFVADQLAMHLSASIVAQEAGDGIGIEVPTTPPNMTLFPDNMPGNQGSSDTQVTIIIAALGAFAGLELVALVLFSVVCACKVARRQETRHGDKFKAHRPQQSQSHGSVASTSVSTTAPYLEPTVSQCYDTVTGYSLEGLGITVSKTGNIHTSPNLSYQHNIVTTRNEAYNHSTSIEGGSSLSYAYPS